MRPLFRLQNNLSLRDDLLRTFHIMLLGCRNQSPRPSFHSSSEHAYHASPTKEQQSQHVLPLPSNLLSCVPRSKRADFRLALPSTLTLACHGFLDRESTVSTYAVLPYKASCPPCPSNQRDTSLNPEAFFLSVQHKLYLFPTRLSL